MPLYFAYGLNMDAADMARRCPRSTPLGVARLPRRRFVVMSCGYASIVPDPRADVHGVLWSLALADVAALDRFEETARGLYTKLAQPVLRGGGASASALVYIGADLQQGAPRPGYIERVVAAATEWRLPAPYLAHLRSFLPHEQRR